MNPAGHIDDVGRLVATIAATGDQQQISTLNWLIEAARAAGPGQRTIATQIGVAARNAELRRVAQEHGLSAAELHKLLTRYYATGWRRDRAAAECPPRLTGRVEARFWIALKARDYPPGPKQLDRILGHELGLFMSSGVPDVELEKECHDADEALPERGQRRAGERE